jgi:hypothetical protein
VVFHVESISSAAFVNHIVYQIALDVYRILRDRRALIVIRATPVEVKTELAPMRSAEMIDRSWTRDRSGFLARCNAPPNAKPRASFAQQSIGRSPRT